MLFQAVAPPSQDSERNLLTQLDEPLDIGPDFQQIGQDRKMSSSERARTAAPKALCKQEGTLAHDGLPVGKGPGPEGRPTPVHFQQHDVECGFVGMWWSADVGEHISHRTHNAGKLVPCRAWDMPMRVSEALFQLGVLTLSKARLFVVL